MLGRKFFTKVGIRFPNTISGCLYLFLVVYPTKNVFIRSARNTYSLNFNKGITTHKAAKRKVERIVRQDWSKAVKYTISAAGETGNAEKRQVQLNPDSILTYKLKQSKYYSRSAATTLKYTNKCKTEFLLFRRNLR